MVDKYGFSWDEAGSGCCGVNEIQNFDEYNGSGYTWRQAEDFDVSAPTKEELWRKVFEKMMNDVRECAFVHIWFVKEAGNRRFEQEGLMKLFENSKHCIKLGTAKNPNSGNIIRGYSFRSFTRYDR